MADAAVIALDIGGTKLAAGAYDQSGRVLAVVRTPSAPAVLDAETLWRAVLGQLDKVDAEIAGRELLGVGVGCGGPMRWPAGVVSPLHIPSWRDFPLRARLQRRYPGVPVHVHNDAVCVAVGEHWRGAGRGRANVLGMVVSTGVGGGLILDGRLINGAGGQAGHIGHVIVEPDGTICPCGARGCLTVVASGPKLTEWARAEGWRSRDGQTAQHLAADAVRGHPPAVAAMQRAGRALGMAIASVARLCDLEVVAIGGGVAQAGPLLFEPVEAALREYLRMPYGRGLRVVPAALGQEAGLIGAAALILAADRYWHPPAARARAGR